MMAWMSFATISYAIGGAVGQGAGRLAGEGCERLHQDLAVAYHERVGRESDEGPCLPDEIGRLPLDHPGPDLECVPEGRGGAFEETVEEAADRAETAQDLIGRQDERLLHIV